MTSEFQFAHTIWCNLWKADIELIEKHLKDYEPLSDAKFDHPILMEIAHQSGRDDTKENLSDDQRERFRRQNKLFRIIWMHDKFKNLWNNIEYRDKYGYTAIEKLRLEYDFYNNEQKQFVKDNICQDIEKVTIHQSDALGAMPMLKNKKYFGMFIVR